MARPDREYAEVDATGRVVVTLKSTKVLLSSSQARALGTSLLALAEESDRVTASYADEEWRDIPNHPGYQASSLGRVRSVDRIVYDKNGRALNRSGQVLKQTLNTATGYYMTGLGSYRTESGGKVRAVHVLVLEAFTGPRPDSDYEACHNDGNQENNRIDNLRWDTRSENGHDKVRHGTHHYAKRDRCSRGHVYAPGTFQWKTSATGSVHRFCVLCSRERNRAYKAKKRLEKHDR